jgi:hypothetical protein
MEGNGRFKSNQTNSPSHGAHKTIKQTPMGKKKTQPKSADPVTRRQQRAPQNSSSSNMQHNNNNKSVDVPGQSGAKRGKYTQRERERERESPQKQRRSETPKK